MQIEAASQKKLLLAQTQQWEMDRLKLQEMQKNAEIESARQQEEANAAREGAQRLLEEFKKKEALLNAKVEEKLKELKEMEASLNNQVQQSEVAAAKEEAAALLKEFKEKEGKLNAKIQQNEQEAARLQAVSIAARQQADALVEREKFLAREAELNAKIVEQQLALEKNKNSEATRRLRKMQAQLEKLQKQNLEHEQNLAAFNNLVMDKDDQTLVSELTGHDKGGIAPQYTERDDPSIDGTCKVNKCGIEFSDQGCFVNCAEEGGFEMMVQGFLQWFMGDGEKSCGSSFWECSTLDDDATFQEKKADYKKKKKMMKEEEAKKGAKKEVVKTETMKSTNSV